MLYVFKVLINDEAASQVELVNDTIMASRFTGPSSDLMVLSTFNHLLKETGNKYC